MASRKRLVLIVPSMYGEITPVARAFLVEPTSPNQVNEAIDAALGINRSKNSLDYAVQRFVTEQTVDSVLAELCGLWDIAYPIQLERIKLVSEK